MNLVLFLSFFLSSFILPSLKSQSRVLCSVLWLLKIRNWKCLICRLIVFARKTNGKQFEMKEIGIKIVQTKMACKGQETKSRWTYGNHWKLFRVRLKWGFNRFLIAFKPSSFFWSFFFFLWFQFGGKNETRSDKFKMKFSVFFCDFVWWVVQEMQSNDIEMIGRFKLVKLSKTASERKGPKRFQVIHSNHKLCQSRLDCHIIFFSLCRFRLIITMWLRHFLKSRNLLRWTIKKKLKTATKAKIRQD